MKRQHVFDIFAASVAALLAALVAGPLLLANIPWPTLAGELLLAIGYVESGAENLVSALYLGYRAWDTIGETIVLLVALSGTVALVRDIEDIPNPELQSVRAPLRQRLQLINSISGKLAPIILLFGLYVVFFGHKSPGGGFQGGVVLASGIIFMALGRREGGLGGLDPRRRIFSRSSLSLLETIGFLLILSLAVLGAFFADGFTANPLNAQGPIPEVAFIIAMNLAIGIKVASGVALVCVFMMGNSDSM